MSRLKRILNKWFTRAILICFLVLVGIGGMCENPYRTNPNLKLLVGDTTTDYDSIHCSNPVVSPDGRKVYFLAADSGGPLSGGIGNLFGVDADGGNLKKILDGKFNALSISHNGTKLAVHVNNGSYFELVPESLILIIHLEEPLTIDSFWITPKRVVKSEWSANDTYLYYNTIDYNKFETTIYRLFLTNSAEEVILSIPDVMGFDLFKNDSIYVDDSIGPYLQIEPANQKYAIGVNGDFNLKFLMFSFSEDIYFNLPDSCNPYVWGSVGSPYWFPDGNTIVFAACPYREGSGAPAEIWILENVFEQIEE